MGVAWNKNRLAYTPLGPFVAESYESGLSYNKVAALAGIPKGCVQNLCNAIGVIPRVNHTTNIANEWEQRLADYVERSGVEVIERPERLTKKSRIITKCNHGLSERPCSILTDLKFCCIVGSKLGQNNPAFGAPSWNSGTTSISLGHGFGWKPDKEARVLPGILYLIRYIDDEGAHCKIGITSQRLEKRFRPYRIAQIIKLWQLPLGTCFDIEQSALKYAKQQGWRYKSSTTTELLREEGLEPILSCIERQLPPTCQAILQKQWFSLGGLELIRKTRWQHETTL
jgi:hypothetical protein